MLNSEVRDFDLFLGALIKCRLFKGGTRWREISILKDPLRLVIRVSLRLNRRQAQKLENRDQELEYTRNDSTRHAGRSGD